MSYVLPVEKQIGVLKLLSEGNSLNSVSRFTKVHRATCTRLMLRFSEACRYFLDRELRDLEFRHLQIDEMWTFVRKKQYRLTGSEPDIADLGDTYIYIALDHDSRLIAAHRVGKRSSADTEMFLKDLKSRMKFPKPHASDAHTFQIAEYKAIVRISTDGYLPYPEEISKVFGIYATHAVLMKDVSGAGKNKKLTLSKHVVRGDIELKDISTSLVERHNLTIRNFMRRAMRKTLGFSKCLENLKAATMINATVYNYCWKVKTLKATPAMAQGIAGHQYSFEELYYLLRDNWPPLFFEQQEVA